jgi:predicted permease
MNHCLADLALAIRLLRSARGFTLLAAATFALGIGANIAVFSVVDRLMFRPLPYADAERLVQVRDYLAILSDAQFSFATMPSEITSVLLDEASTIEDLAWEIGPSESTIPVPGENPLELVPVTPNLLRVLGVRPYLGRDLHEHDMTVSDRAVLLSHDAWVGRFGASPDALSVTWRIGRRGFRVVGVLPPAFLLPSSRFREKFDGIVASDDRTYSNTGQLTIAPVGRLRPNASVETAQAESDVLLEAHPWKHLSLRRRAESQPVRVTIQPLRAAMALVVGPYLWVVSGIVWLVLLATCINLSILLMVRARARQSVSAVLAALGASPVRLARVAILESLAVATIGTVVALIVCTLVYQWVVTIVPAELRGLMGHPLESRVLQIGLVTAWISAVVAGAMPAWSTAHLDVLAALRQVPAARRRRRLFGTTGISLGCQAAFGALITAVAAVTVPPFVGFLLRPPGFDARDLFTIAVNHGWDGPALGARRGTDRIAAIGSVFDSLPRVTNWAPAAVPPFAESLDGGFWKARGLEGARFFVGEGMFRATRTPMLVGREFIGSDRVDNAGVAVLNRTGAETLWPGLPLSDVLGNTVEVEGRTRIIVGIAGDIRSRPGGQVPPGLFLPLTPTLNELRQSAVSVVVRMDRGAVPDAQLMTSRLNERFPANRVTVASVERQLAPHTEQPRFLAILFGTLAGIAVLLGAVGTYSVVSLDTTLRRRQFGICLALGARPSRLYREILGRVLLPVVVGIGVGVAATHLLTLLPPVIQIHVGSVGFGASVAAITVVLLTAIVATVPRLRQVARIPPMSTITSP